MMAYRYEAEARVRLTVTSSIPLTIEQVRETAEELLNDDVGIYMFGSEKEPVNVSASTDLGDIDVDEDCWPDEEDDDTEQGEAPEGEKKT